MNSRLFKAGFSLLPGLAGFALGVGAQITEGANDRVEVANVRFNALRPPEGASDNWLEMDIELDVRPAATSPGRMTRPLRVEAMLAYDRPGTESIRLWEFYRASGVLVGLATGRAHVRFYLPPEIVNRDHLGGVPKFWEVTIRGESLTRNNPSGRASPALSVADVHKSFRARLGAEGPANDGILQIQYLTPFATAYPRSTPTYVRPEAWR